MILEFKPTFVKFLDLIMWKTLEKLLSMPFFGLKVILSQNIEKVPKWGNE